jgi:hypothetical protein
MAWIWKFEVMAKRIEKRKATFCEQKVAKKLFLCWAMGGVADNAHSPA